MEFDVEEVIQDTSDRRARVSLTGKRHNHNGYLKSYLKRASCKTELVELNRVLGGGVVPGSLVLIGGDPGIGKSTLLLQVSQQLAPQVARFYMFLVKKVLSKLNCERSV